MNNFEFIDYTETPNESYFRGIVTARLYGKIIVKYKVVDKKDGSGFFISSPNYRLSQGDSHQYINALMLDSRMEEEQLMQVLRNGINQRSNPSPQQKQNLQSGDTMLTVQQNYQPDLNSCPF